MLTYTIMKSIHSSLCTIIYEIFNQLIVNRLKKKSLPTEDEDYNQMIKTNSTRKVKKALRNVFRKQPCKKINNTNYLFIFNIFSKNN